MQTARSLINLRGSTRLAVVFIPLDALFQKGNQLRTNILSQMHLSRCIACLRGSIGRGISLQIITIVSYSESDSRRS